MPRPSLLWLLVFVPLSLALELAHAPPLAVFVTAAIAIIPLAGLISRATESLAAEAGPRVGALLNATFGNITELIVAILLVAAGHQDVAKASLMGSILGNILLVLGASCLAGGLRYRELKFSARSTGVSSTSLLLAVLALLMPALFVSFDRTSALQREVVSVVVAVVLMVLYVAALIFVQFTHAPLFRATASTGEPEWRPRVAVLVLLAAALLVGLESELLVGTLEPTVAALGVSPLFIGLFVVAIIGNAAEHASAVVFALHNKLEISVEIAFGSSTQIALFVAPLLVLISLGIGHPMDFVFSPFEVAAVFLSTLIVGVVVLDGRSNWLEGVQLLGAYVILAISFFFVGSTLGT
ncbi:MAG: calcium/proton exchanger [Candidatus Dormibacteraeota bacterium]|nr:calcium/proton exchanger [Candidatus Dormibacteraeota bacterium]